MEESKQKGRNSHNRNRHYRQGRSGNRNQGRNNSRSQSRSSARGGARGPVKRELLVEQDFQQSKLAILENSQLEEFYIEHDESSQLVGSIFKGKVSSIVPGIGAAFISVGLERNGFLYVGDVAGGDMESADDGSIDLIEDNRKPKRAEPKKQERIQDLLKKDEEILVQVVKEPFGTKGARLTGQITLPGRYVVLMPFHSHRGVSKRIEDAEERNRIRDIIKSLSLPDEVGLIVRTAAWGCSKEDLQRDVRFLMHQWKLIQRRFKVKDAPSLIHEEYGIVLRMLRDVVNDKFHSITIDSPEEYRKAKRYTKATVPSLAQKINLYKGSTPLFVLKNIERELERIFEPKAQLKSGGSIVIEQTEALVSIDVNTGKFTGKSNLEDTAFRTNCEAAREIAKQVRLRDMGGIIIIDFIDMDNSDHKRQVLRILEDSLKRDRAKTSVLNISQLGLVEMTRQRMRKSLHTTNTQTCTYCMGKGVVKSNKRIAIEALHKADSMARKSRNSHIEIMVTPEVADVLLKSNQSMVRRIEKDTKSKINVLVDTNLLPEEIRLKRVLDKRKLYLL